MAKKTKPAVGHPLTINKNKFTITGIDADANRVDYEETPKPKGRNASKGVLALGELVWADDADAWGLPGREMAKADTGGVKRVTGPAPTGTEPVKPMKGQRKPRFTVIPNG